MSAQCKPMPWNVVTKVVKVREKKYSDSELKRRELYRKAIDAPW